MMETQIFITRLIMILFSVVPIVILIAALYIDFKTPKIKELDTLDKPIRQIYIKGQGWVNLDEGRLQTEKEYNKLFKLLMELILKDEE